MDYIPYSISEITSNFQRGIDGYRQILINQRYNMFDSDLELYLASIACDDIRIFKQSLAYLGRKMRGGLSEENIAQFVKIFPIPMISVAFRATNIMAFYLNEFYANNNSDDIPGLFQSMEHMLPITCYKSDLFEKVVQLYSRKKYIHILFAYLLASGKHQEAKKLETSFSESFKNSLFEGSSASEYVGNKLYENLLSYSEKEDSFQTWAIENIYNVFAPDDDGDVRIKYLLKDDKFENDLRFLKNHMTISSQAVGPLSVFLSCSEEDKKFTRDWLTNLRYEKLQYDGWFDGALRFFKIFGTTARVHNFIIANKWFKYSLFLGKELNLENHEYFQDFVSKFSEVEEKLNKVMSKKGLTEQSREMFRTDINNLYSLIKKLEDEIDIPLEFEYKKTALQPLYEFTRASHEIFVGFAREESSISVRVDNQQSLKYFTPSGYEDHIPTNEKSFYHGRLITIETALTRMLEGYRMCKYYLTGVMDPLGTTYDYNDPNLKPLFFYDKSEFPFYWDVKINKTKNPNEYLLNASIKYLVYDNHIKAYHETGIAMPHCFTFGQLRSRHTLPMEFWTDLRQRGMLSKILDKHSGEFIVSNFAFNVNFASYASFNENYIYGGFHILSYLISKVSYDFFNPDELELIKRTLGDINGDGESEEGELVIRLPSLREISDPRMITFMLSSLGKRQEVLKIKETFPFGFVTDNEWGTERSNELLLDYLLGIYKFKTFGVSIYSEGRKLQWLHALDVNSRSEKNRIPNFDDFSDDESDTLSVISNESAIEGEDGSEDGSEENVSEEGSEDGSEEEGSEDGSEEESSDVGTPRNRRQYESESGSDD